MSVSTSRRWFGQLISAIHEIWSRKIVIVCRPFKKEITDVSIFCFIIIISSLRNMTSLRGKIPSLDITDNFLTYFLISKPKWGKSFYGCYQGSVVCAVKKEYSPFAISNSLQEKGNELRVVSTTNFRTSRTKKKAISIFYSIIYSIILLS